MPLHIVKNDIAKMRCDAIINAANEWLRPGSGVCGAIFAAANAPALEAACQAIGHCPTGQAVATEGFGLACNYIIHTVGPIWEGGSRGEAELLRSAYESALRLMEEKGCRSGAFPLLSSGVYGYPMREALDIAISTMQAYLQHSDLELYLVIYSRKSTLIGKEQFYDIQSHIDNSIVSSNISPREFRKKAVMYDCCETCCAPAPVPEGRKGFGNSLKELLSRKEESFSEMVLRLIRERNLDEVAVYKAANLDRKLFSKLRSNRDYQPKKSTALALAVGLRLDLSETEALLEKAGFALSSNSKQDIIVKYFIQKEVFDIMTINEALFDFEQHLLGA